jgi:hypothetical protein
MAPKLLVARDSVSGATDRRHRHQKKHTLTRARHPWFGHGVVPLDYIGVNERLRNCRGVVVLDAVLCDTSYAKHGGCFVVTSNQLAGIVQRILAPAPSKGAPVRPLSVPVPDSNT